jgi:hypothetical protein
VQTVSTPERSAHPLSEQSASKQWASGFRRLTPRDQRPHAACDQCYSDATSPDTGPLLEFRCPRGHVFHRAKTLADQHAVWLARFSTGIERNT